MACVYVSATGVESEAELPFASLHELLRPLVELLPRIPASQARAVAAALALEDGEPDALSVGAGTLSLLVEAAEAAPLGIVLDDAHWLDSASADALAFAARRLTGEEIAFLVATRPVAHGFAGFPSIEIGPLTAAEGRLLLEARSEPIPVGSESAFLEVAAGNPLALLEMPLELALDLPRHATPHERLNSAFAHRIDALPEPCRRGLLLAAAEPDLRAVTAAAQALSLADPLGPAELTGLVQIDGVTIVFRHPVLRSLVYASADPSERREAHRALGATLMADADRDRRAWHLAAAAAGTDEEAASLLEETADRAASRGGQAAAARALERAAHLSVDANGSARRLYAASRAAFWAGEAARALELAETALPLSDDPLLRADLLVQVGAIGQWHGGSVTEAMYVHALDAGGLDDERTSKLLYEVVKLRLDALDADGAVVLAPRLETAARNAGPWWGPRHLAGAAAAYLWSGDTGRAEALFRELTSNPAIPAGFAYDYLALEWYDELRASLDETLREGRAAGNLLRVVWNQSCTAHLELRLGRLNAATAAAAEAIPLGEAIGMPALVGSASSALAGVHAWRGQAEACRTTAAVGVAAARNSGDRYQEAAAQHAVALLALGEGRPDQTIHVLLPHANAWAESSIVEPSVAAYLPDLVDALVQRGEIADARGWLDRLTRTATAANRVWALAACARCEGLMATADAFDEPFQHAVQLLEQTPLALELARTRLAYGERLRRQGRKSGARTQLRQAHQAFATAAAAPWEARAASELRAAGEQVETAERALPDLTPQEAHIAQLVTAGKTNKAIAAALFLSPKTVEYHLTSTYRKLDIHSRAELARIVAREEHAAQGTAQRVD